MWGRYALHHGYPEPPTAPLNSKWKMGMDTIIGIVYGHSTILWWVRIGAGVMVSVWMELCLPQIFFVKICKNLSRISACQEFFLRANYHLPYVCSWAATTRHFVVLRRVWVSIIKYIFFEAFPLLAPKCRVGARVCPWNSRLVCKVQAAIRKTQAHRQYIAVKTWFLRIWVYSVSIHISFKCLKWGHVMEIG